ncbi:MAG TPA: radical SAM protein [Pseudonocardiaceae bacterium]
MSAEQTEKTDLWLAFPPLVETNFGSFYPSTAVLAAYLERQGLRTVQDDLNEEFALWLLCPDTARERLADPRLNPTSSAAAATRWLARHADMLFDAERRHDFGPTSRYGHVLQLLAQHYLVDPGPDVVDRTGGYARAAEPYQRFYRQLGLDGRIADGTSMIGISVPMGPQLLPALVLAQHLRDLRPRTPIVLGGPALSLMSPAELGRLLTNWDAVDAVVRFDGEQPLHELLVQAREGRWEPAQVAGVSYRDGDAVRHNEPGVGLPVNALPAPLYPVAALAALADPALGVTQARGCYWGKCDYCDFIELYDGSPPFRGRHPVGFVAELRLLAQRHGVRRFSFITESLPPAFARRLCELLLAERLDLRWTSFAMVDRRFDRELLASIVAAGCEFLVVGMETTITRVLKLVHKSADREQNLRFLRDAREVGLPLVVNLIPDLPTTTYDEAMTALDDVREFTDTMRSVSVFPFEPTRSSNVGRTPERFGLDVRTPSVASGQAQYALNHLTSTDPAMTTEQRARVHARYRTFADEVNGRRCHDVVAASRPDDRMRIAVEDIDLVTGADGLVCTNLRTRSRAVIPTRAAKLLEHYWAGASFTPAALRAELSPLVADQLLANLTEAALLAPAGGEAGHG